MNKEQVWMISTGIKGQPGWITILETKDPDIIAAIQKLISEQHVIKRKADYKNHIENQKKTHGKAWERWTKEEDDKLVHYFKAKKSKAELIKIFQRSPNAIFKRLVKFGLLADDAVW